MAFTVEKTELEGLLIITPKVCGDERGFFMETYKKSEFEKIGIATEFIQDNHSKSAKGVLRGLHYQAKPFEQAKLVRCINGKILDVAVDIRPESKTFGKWASIELSDENKRMFYIPEGFAHGFVALSPTAEIADKVNNEYSPLHDRGLVWNDEQINIDWGIDFEPTLSTKDLNQPQLSEINKEELL